jgi:flavin reductase (DIM6/NTAB) family NADH-FMN oxidoreductase RutF
MSKVAWKGAALLAPVPVVMVSCGKKEEKPNIVTVAWTGILSSQPPKTYVSIREERYSYGIIKETGEFVVNLVNKPLTRAADLLGVKSGRDFDKFALAGLTPEKATKLACPMIAESPVSLECRVFDSVNLGAHTMFMADILSVNVKEEFIDAAGRFAAEECALISYCHGSYFGQGEYLGKFGYSVQK